MSNLKYNFKYKVANFFRHNTFFLILGVLLVVYVLTMLLTFSYGLMNSLKSAKEYDWNRINFPQEGWQFSNYALAMTKIFVKVRIASGGFKYVGILQMYLNTILYAMGCAFFSTFIPCCTAYLTGRFNYKFSGVIVGIVIVTMSLPIVGSTPSSLQLARALGLYDSIYGMWLMSAHFQVGIHFLVFHEAFRNFPVAYKEAAEIDGANHIQVMFRIMIPLVKNVFITVFLLRLIGLWNDYQTPLLYIPNKPTIAYGLYYFSFVNTDNQTFSVPMQLTGAFLLSVPIFIVFVVFQKRIMTNISIGGIKG